MIADRRRSARMPCRTVVELSARPGWPFVPCEARNISVVGICVRFPKELELRSPVRLRVWKSTGEPIECDGQVNWTMGRSDICQQPPYPYDIGIEFDGLPQTTGTLLAALLEEFGQSWVGTTEPRRTEAPGVMPVTIRGQRYVPDLAYQPGSGTWHLVIYRGKTPYYSQRFANCDDAAKQWQAFKTTMARRSA